MKILLIGAAAIAAGAIATAPAVAGLAGNSSFSRQIPVQVPTQANAPHLVDDHSPAAQDRPTVTHSRQVEPGDDRGATSQHVEPGDDHGATSQHVEPGDDRGATSQHVEPGDDRGATSQHVEPGDDHGGHRGHG